MAGSGYDQIVVAGSVTLAGELQGTLFNNFNPNLNDRLYVVINDGIDPVIGAFSNVAEGGMVNVGGRSFVLTYLANSVTNSFSGGNDVALLIPEPTAAASLWSGVGALLGLSRLRRRRS